MPREQVSVQDAIVLNWCLYIEAQAATLGGDYGHAQDAFREFVRQLEIPEPQDDGDRKAGGVYLLWANSFLARASYLKGDYTTAEQAMARANALQDFLKTRNPRERFQLSSSRVIFAQILARRGHRAEAWKVIEPELKFHRALLAGGSDSVSQHELFANALYAAALSSPEHARPFLAEAAAILDRSPPESKRLRSHVLLRRWISEEMTR